MPLTHPAPNLGDDGSGVRSLLELAALSYLGRCSQSLQVVAWQLFFKVQAISNQLYMYSYCLPEFVRSNSEISDWLNAIRKGFLEEECAAYVTMTNIDSPVWKPVRERLLEVLAQHIDSKSIKFMRYTVEGANRATWSTFYISSTT